jgi:hypothetical protein
MSQQVRGVFHDGVFVPPEPCDLPEGSEVRLTVDDPFTIPPEITDPAERAAVLKDIVRSMRENPIPANAPRFTSDEMHERR